MTVGRPRDPTVLAVLAERAASLPDDPWLFERRGWDWRWRSWSQVADQAARGAAVLRRALASAAPAGGDLRVGFDGGQDPDALACGLAIQAAGFTAVPMIGGPAEPPLGAWAEVAAGDGPVTSAEGGILRVALPACRSRLERWRPEPLELDARAAGGGLAFGPAAPRLSQESIYGAAGHLAGSLPERLGPRRRGRPILCASPSLGPRAVQVLLAWTVHREAAWVLEPDADAFLEAVLWARPTVVVAAGPELGRLAAALGERKHRRHQRLRAVAVAGEEPPDSTLWADLEVPVVLLRHPFWMRAA